MRAFIFPGQGSQKVGMGVEISQLPAARLVFEEVDEALSQNLFSIMRDGPEQDLTLTENAQPAIMANAMATLRVLEIEFGISLAENAGCVAGHSLGEYTALCSVGAFNLTETARLLKLRGKAMQEAVPVGVGAMAALLGADLDKATALVAKAAEEDVCEVANDNDPTQVVISGHKSAINRAVDMAKEFGIKRGVILPVSAPFHCSLMQAAANQMSVALDKTKPRPLELPIFANFTASKVQDADEVQDLLVNQVTGRVRWRESIIAMHNCGFDDFVELGGKVLGPMVSRTEKNVRVRNLDTIGSLEGFAREIG
jgi:[acyl-carrier-protein] S-malonyltransferase